MNASQGPLARTLEKIGPLDGPAMDAARARQDQLTKPPGSLGVLEELSLQLSGLARRCPPPLPEPAALAVFAADHGVHAQRVTPWPQEVTAQMVANFRAGGAAANVLAATVGAHLRVVDVGVATPLPVADGPFALLDRKIRPGTGDMTAGAAMSREEARRAVEVGIDIADDLVDEGFGCLLTGDMGIANTTASAALVAAFTDRPARAVTGRGTGVDNPTWERKVTVVTRALELHRPDPGDPLGVLAAVGGLEHAALTGYVLAAAARRVPVILDGVIAVAAALAARALAADATGAMVAGHMSTEPAAPIALTALGLRPLVRLDMRLGEGTGALLALPVVQGAARVVREMASFDSAGVTNKDQTR
jgi:nicotinate-nucleotide--dimethylbenzimidazole phosphoribosyltransferase